MLLTAGSRNSTAVSLFAMLIAFVAACGGSVGTTMPSHGATPTFDKVGLAQLEAKPLILPVVSTAGACPGHNHHVIDLGTASTTVIGDGPMYLSGKGLQASTTWGDYYDPTYYAGPQLTGIVLLRIRDIMTGRAGVFVGPYAAGDVVGTDTIDGSPVQQHAEAVLDESHHAATPGRSKWGIWDVRQGYAAGWSRCFGFQLDGAGFSEVITGET